MPKELDRSLLPGKSRQTTMMVVRVMPPPPPRCPLWDCADVVKWRIWRWRGYSGLSSGPHVIARGKQRSVSDACEEDWPAIASLEDEGAKEWGQPLEAGKGQDTDGCPPSFQKKHRPPSSLISPS